MIEIFALIYLSRKIGNLADQKGQKRGLGNFTLCSHGLEQK
jgi:hypothetical protein